MQKMGRQYLGLLKQYGRDSFVSIAAFSLRERRSDGFRTGARVKSRTGNPSAHPCVSEPN